VLAPLFDERPFHILTITEVTRDIKEILEDTFASVWVEGEISNWRVVQSGHAYFTLKDAQTQLRTVMFRSALRQLPFEPEAGMQVVARGRLTVYEPRGDYQLLARPSNPKAWARCRSPSSSSKNACSRRGCLTKRANVPCR
jgi:exodeoxyribonuclease VII large subunit